MTMTTLLDAFVAKLRAVLTCPVEKYWRLDPPAVLKVWVSPLSEQPEEGLAIGNMFGEELRLTVIAEVPWDDTAACAELVVTTVETIKAQVHANRDLAGGIKGRHYGTQYRFVQRAGIPASEGGGIYYSSNTTVGWTWQDPDT